MNFADCLQAAVAAGELNPERAKLAQQRWRELSDRYETAGMSPADARQTAADELVTGITREVIKRRHVTVRQLQTLQKNQARYANADDPDLLLQDVEHIQSEAGTIFKQAMSGLQQFLADHREDIFGRVRDRAQLQDILRELHGEDSGNANAKAIAGGVDQARERLRNMFNSLGGDIGKLDDYGVAHVHDGQKLRAAGFDVWFDDIWQRLDWNRIENFKTGKPFAPSKGVRPFREDAIAFLRPIFDEITTKGWADRTPGFSVGARALFNGRGEHRVLHFRSADDWMEYNDSFGGQNTFEAIIGQFHTMSRDIARMRAFGPNPKAGLENAIQVLEKAAQLAPRNPKAAKAGVFRRVLRLGLQPEELVQMKARKARVMMGILSGELNRPVDQATASILAGTRNLLTAAQLGSATISQVTDLPSMRLAARAIGLNPNSPLKLLFNNVLNGMDPTVAKDLGFILDSWAQSSATYARFAGDIWSPELTGRISNFVLKANGMTYLTDRERVAVAMAFGSDMAGMAGRSFDQLPKNMQNFMSNRGIDARDWDLLRDPSVIYTDAQGGKHLNPNWFRDASSLPAHEAEDLAIRFGALIEDHIEMSIPSSSLRGRASLIGENRPGTWTGELMRSSMMYKGFVLSQLFNQMRRVRELDGDIGTRAWYAATMVAQLTAYGALAVQLKEIAKGRDPRPMISGKFWAAAFMQGGGVGIFGDFFSASTSRAGGGFGETLAGPVVGLASDVSRAVGSNVARMAEGKSPLIGRDIASLGRRYNPLATLWPTRIALDRLVWDQLQLLLDPEAEEQWYQAERRMKRNYGTESWWQRGDLRPRRAPDPGNIIGAVQ
ncbi:hypothetical protein [Paracoccus marinaquae]|uniref:Phage protein n=1 Tax=Paracoccus marinaquae TaxID=2841926 RepID=A0ABS6ANZ2_9RHOB|nr:hypothetical protein [Paracoccus marinaquae]MBU3031359.1 hypothetical protein [Paracoccus marinaquae]